MRKNIRHLVCFLAYKKRRKDIESHDTNSDKISPNVLFLSRFISTVFLGRVSASPAPAADDKPFALLASEHFMTLYLVLSLSLFLCLSILSVSVSLFLWLLGLSDFFCSY